MPLTEDELNTLLELCDKPGKRTEIDIDMIADLIDQLEKNGNLKIALSLLLTSPSIYSRERIAPAVLKRLGFDQSTIERIIAKASES